MEDKNTTPATQEPRIGVYVCQCGLNIAQTVDCKKVAEIAENLPNVVVARSVTYSCSEPGQREMKSDILEYGLDRIVVASCSPRLQKRPSGRWSVGRAQSLYAGDGQSARTVQLGAHARPAGCHERRWIWSEWRSDGSGIFVL